jgi:radical SAM superfamily enzyme YgiQ (UPF0313 family)
MYELPPFRPPSEASSVLLRVTRGCPWNRCKFCGMYKNMKFERRRVEDVKSDIKRAREIYGKDVRRIFIGDSDSIILKDELQDILNFLHDNFPNLERVTSYGRAATILRKDVEELKMLSEAGLKRLHVGLETGDAELLEYMQKGATPQQMIRAGKKVKESGISLSEYVILGLGGSMRSEQHAINTARILNEINPDFIRVRTLHPLPNTQLWELAMKNEFEILPPIDVLREEKLLIQNLDVGSHFVSDHISNYLIVDGKLPEDRNGMLEFLEITIDSLERVPEIEKDILQPSVNAYHIYKKIFSEKRVSPEILSYISHL